FSLDCTNAIAVAVARATFHLPYFRARMRCNANGGEVDYHSERAHRGAAPAQLHCCYRAMGQVFEARPGTLEYFLTERYCLYAEDAQGHIFRGEIQHPPWRLQPAEAEIGINTMAEAAGIVLPPDKPLLHFAERQDMVAWAPQHFRRT